MGGTGATEGIGGGLTGNIGYGGDMQGGFGGPVGNAGLTSGIGAGTGLNLNLGGLGSIGGLSGAPAPTPAATAPKPGIGPQLKKAANTASNVYNTVNPILTSTGLSPSQQLQGLIGGSASAPASAPAATVAPGGYAAQIAANDKAYWVGQITQAQKHAANQAVLAAKKAAKGTKGTTPTSSAPVGYVPAPVATQSPASNAAFNQLANFYSPSTLQQMWNTSQTKV